MTHSCPQTRHPGHHGATLHALFPTLVYQNSLEDASDLQPLFATARQQYGFRPEGGSGGQHFTGEYHGQSRLHQSADLDPFFAHLAQHVALYLRSLGMKPELFDVHCLKTWFVICEPPDESANDQPADALVPHNHSGSDISWVYYVDVPDDCPAIRFHAGRTPASAPFESAFHYDWQDDQKSSLSTINWWNSDVWSIQPSTGDLLIFAGHQLHSVESNHTSATRLSVAGDIALTVRPEFQNLEFGRTDPSDWKTLRREAADGSKP